MLYELMGIYRKYSDPGESTGAVLYTGSSHVSVNGCGKLSAEGRIKPYSEGEACHHREVTIPVSISGRRRILQWI